MDQRPRYARWRWIAPALLLTLPATGLAARHWPSFLAPADTFSPSEAWTIEHTWSDPTLHRSVEGPRAPMPLAAYLALVDTPDLTASAARHLGLARYEVHPLGAGWYEADDHEGAHGVYHVLVREDGRRVTLSWGRRSGSLLGTIGGSALTVMHFEADGEDTRQRLETFVVIDNAVAAGLARTLIAIFGNIADRKLAHGFAVTAKVAAWAREHPDDFCAWLAAEPVDDDRRDHLRAGLHECEAIAPQAARSLAR